MIIERRARSLCELLNTCSCNLFRLMSGLLFRKINAGLSIFLLPRSAQTGKKSSPHHRARGRCNPRRLRACGELRRLFPGA